MEIQTIKRRMIRFRHWPWEIYRLKTRLGHNLVLPRISFHFIQSSLAPRKIRKLNTVKIQINGAIFDLNGARSWSTPMKLFTETPPRKMTGPKSQVHFLIRWVLMQINSSSNFGNSRGRNFSPGLHHTQKPTPPAPQSRVKGEQVQPVIRFLTR